MKMAMQNMKCVYVACMYESYAQIEDQLSWKANKPDLLR